MVDKKQAYSRDIGQSSSRCLLSCLFFVFFVTALLPSTMFAANKSAGMEKYPIIQHGQAKPLKIAKNINFNLQGATATELPNGKWLILGGLHADTPQVDTQASIYDSSRETLTHLETGLKQARAFHTATLLPDGNVLVLGGNGPSQLISETAEIFNPDTGLSTQLELSIPQQRAQHRATLLSDGRVLVTGGTSVNGKVRADITIVNPRDGIVETLPQKLVEARYNHNAMLLPNHEVLIWGGIDANELPIKQAELYHSESASLTTVDDVEAAQRLTGTNTMDPATLQSSFPNNAAIDVPINQLLSMSFSKSLKPSSINQQTVVLIGPNGLVPSTVTPAENGILVFVVPNQDLLPGTDYSLIVQGAIDQQERAVDLVSIEFKTQTLSSTAKTTLPENAESNTAAPSSPDHEDSSNDQGPQVFGQNPNKAEANSGSSGVTRIMAGAAARFHNTNQQEDDEVWIPGKQNRQGHWRTDKPGLESAAELLDNAGLLHHKVKAMRARVAKTKNSQPKNAKTQQISANAIGVKGTVLRLNDKPLANVTISIGSRFVKTDNQGQFVLTGIASGHHELVVDGATADHLDHHYLRFIMGVDVQGEGLTELSHYIYVPRISYDDWVNIPSPTTQKTVVTHPLMPGLEIHIPKGTVFRDRDGKVLTRIALVPVPLDRAPYPVPDGFPTYFMLHPGGAVVEGNAPEAAEGIRIIYPNSTGGTPGSQQHLWVYDARTNGWVIYGHATVSTDGQQVIPDSGIGLHEHMGAGHSPPLTSPGPQPETPSDPCGKMKGDPVECSSGIFFHERTDISLPDDLPINITRTYRPGDTVVRPFGKGTNHSLGLYLRMPNINFMQIDLMFPDGRRFAFPYLSGTVLHADYVWEHTATSSEFYRARIYAKLDQEGEHWDLYLQDGTHYQFGISGQLDKIKDRYGNLLLFTRSGGRLLRVTSNSGRTIDFTYDAQDRITQLKDILGRVWIYEYYPSGHQSADFLKKVTYPDGTSEEYTYDSDGRMLTVKDRRDQIMVTNEYDADGRVKKQTLADTGVFRFEYTVDANQKIIQTDIIDPRNHTERMQFNSMGYVTRRIRALGLPEEQSTDYTYNASNFVESQTDALGRITRYEYDGRGNRTRITRLFGTPQAVSWNYTYEPVFQQIQTITDPLNQTTEFSYDAYGNLIRILDPEDNKVDFTYDERGHIKTVTRYHDTTPLATAYGYDGADLISVQDPLNRIYEYFPDAAGRIVNVKDALGRFTHMEYDDLDRVAAITDPQGKSQHRSYDGNGNVLSFTDAKNQTTTFTYDPLNRLKTKQDALLKQESYDYDLNGNLLFVTDRKSQVTGYRYDALNRLTQIGYGATATAAPVYTGTIDYQYDVVGRLTQIQDSANGTISRTYDDRFDKLQQEVSAQGTVDYTYDAAGRRQTMTPSGGTTVTYDYDNAYRLTGIEQAAGTGGGALPAVQQSVSISYDSADRPTVLTLPNGMTMTYGYDNASQLTGITYKKADDTLIGNLSYSYNAVGNRIATGGTLARTGLPEAVTDSQHDANNQLTERDTVAYTYDDNGNLISDGSRTYTWNARDQLTAISGADTASFEYDGLGRRRTATVNGQTTHTLYDGWNPVQRQAGGAVLENRLYGLGLDRIFARTQGGVTESYLTDALGSILELRNAAQNPTVEYTYDPYGNTAGSAASTNTIKYTGREQDLEDLYYYRHRYYKPSVGRFISEDPIGLAGGSNLYAYVGGNPVNLVDPLGLYWGENYVNYVGGAVGGTGDFVSQYFRQLDATYWTGRSHNGWANQDKYFHCMANCEASQRGKGGEDAAVCISNAREATDQFMGDPPSASAADQLANKFGRSQGAANPNGSCQNLCGKYRPGGSFPF
jgi:RHS repeat-associated protein